MYTNINYDFKKNEIHLWDDSTGYRKIKYSPYYYIPTPNGPYEALDGTKLEKVNGKTDDVNAYESDIRADVRTLIDLYHNSDTPSTGHRELYFDIEVDISKKKSTPQEAECAITSIAYLDVVTKDRAVLILDQKNKLHKDIDSEYNVEIFKSEEELISRFINIFAEIQPTIISGWNVDGFDIPYLINRTKRILGMNVARRLSPVNILDYNSRRDQYIIFGVTSLDYLKLYKNFTYTELPNYRLDTVAKTELGRGKIEYDGDLNDLYESDIEKFIEYNMVDVDLVYELDQKLQLINLARTICHKGHVPYSEVFYASAYLDGAAIVDLKRNGYVAPSKQATFVEDLSDDEILKGAYVMKPVTGLYKWIYDLDLTSLYPSIIMSLNISPETLCGVIQDWDENDLVKSDLISKTVIINGQEIEIDDVKAWLLENNLSVASNGAIYDKTTKGFLPSILEKWFDERVTYKDSRDKHDVGSDEYKFYDALQLTQKVLLNSFYGVLGLKTFRFYNLENAGAITSTGQSIIKFTANCINKYYTNELGVDHFYNSSGFKSTFSFYTDTDSTFVSSLPLIASRYKGYDETDEEFMIQKTNEIAAEIQSHINKLYDMYAIKLHNISEHRFEIKQEYVAKSGVWVAKKRYAQWIVFKEGKPTDKMDIKGLDVIRSSFPTDFKTIMKTVLWYILKDKSKQETTDLIMNFKSNIQDSDILDVMKNSGVKGITKYSKGRVPFGAYLSRTPVHVKASLNYNDLLYKNNDTLSDKIQNNDKIKWAYLKENPYGFDVIALIGYNDPDYITEFVTKYIDRMKIFDKELRTKLDDIYEGVGWQKLPENNNMNKFFSF